MTRLLTAAMAAATLLAGTGLAAADAEFNPAIQLFQFGRGASPIPRTTVSYPTSYAPGTIVIETRERRLYLVQPNGTALRYGVGLGRQGYSWKGRAVVQWKRKWPTWTPPDAMIKRDPKLEKWRQGMPPGISNPLGSRALYIFKDGQDTLYRIHGSPEWRPSASRPPPAACACSTRT